MEEKDFRLASMPYAQCHVKIKRYGERCEEQSIDVELWSYYTHVMSISYHADSQSFDVIASGTYSVTTARHINRFTKEFLGINLYHDVKRACTKELTSEWAKVPVAIENTVVEQAFFNRLSYYDRYGKRFHLRKENRNAHVFWSSLS